MSHRAHIVWTFAITSIALFMTTLDNLVVTMALPTMQRDLHASISGLEWTVNAYTLTFAVLLMLGAALGDRFGRKRVFLVGLGIFTLGSAAAALSPSIEWLIGARALQGVGGAIVTPLTLTILSDAVPVERRGSRSALWGGVSGLGVALGPLVGGAVVQGLSWQWIFWLERPIGLVADPAGPVAAAREPRPDAAARRDRRRPHHRLGARPRVGPRQGQLARLDEPGDRGLADRAASCSSSRSSPGSGARASRCCRCASSATGHSRPRTPRRSSCSSACSGRSSS